VPERPVRLLEKLEKFALENGLFTVCASQSMSNALQTYYSSVKSPYVVYNGFSKSENIVTDLSKKDNPKKKLIWFSRTVGSNRGIEKIIDAIQYFSFPVELHLLGEAEQSFKKDIEIMFPFSKGHALCFHDFIPHTELTKFLSDFDLGLALEEDINDNKRLTVSNKILQYIQSGIKVLATNTKGQIEVQSYFKETIGLVGNDEDSAAWANAAMLMLNKPAVDVNNNLKIFNQVFSQEAQEEKLVTLAETYF
jgi:glycosyltransferase involved in cell wall biosynthesis